MYTSLANRLALVAAGPSVEFTQPVSMEDANAARLDFVIFNIQGTTNVRLQGSDDLENWKDIGAAGTGRTTPGYYREGLVTNIAFAYIRVKAEHTTSGGDFVVLDAGVYVFAE